MAASKVDVEALILAARRADQPALDRLLALYRNYLRLIAHNLLSGQFRSKADSSDLVQDTLLEAHQAFARFEGTDEQALLAWLRKILASNVTDFVRRYRAAARDVGREERPVEDHAAALNRIGRSLQPSPSQSAQRRELGVVLADALALLRPDQREVIVLRNLQDLPWQEIGQRMGRSEDAVRHLWTRALVQLRPHLGDLL